MAGRHLGGLGIVYGFFFNALILIVLISLIVIILLHYTFKRALIIRRVTSISMLVLGCLVAVTGILIILLEVLSLESVLGLTRYDLLWWHTLFGIIMIGVAFIHLYLNWIAFKVLFGLTSRAKR